MTKILIVDDEESIRRLLGRILKKEGYDCILAASADEARRSLKKHDFEIVISDINMPGESGLDFIKHVLAEHRDTATLMITVVDDLSVVESLFELGVYGYINKPFQVKNALISIKNALHRRRLEIENRIYSEKMESLVSERTEALQESNKELEETLSRLKETQAHMIQSEKMASIGQLAAGIAHEINNPTGFVSSNLTTLLEYKTDLIDLIEEYRKLISELKDLRERNPSISGRLDHIASIESEANIDFILDDFQALIEESLEGTERIKKIIADLKDIAHPGEDILKSADINKNLDSSLNIVWNELKYKAAVKKDYGNLPIVSCYPRQLNQVFTNLLVNAGQAIEEQGEISITTRLVDENIEIKISDTGMGIPKKNLPKLFEPFFTTKEIGKGTGLGLNIVYRIIQKHKGTINVESEQGKGTTFTIRIPAQWGN